MRVTYFGGAFVFDGHLALLFAVIDVAQLVVEEIRRRRRCEQNERDERGNAGPEHVVSRESVSAGTASTGASAGFGASQPAAVNVPLMSSLFTSSRTVRPLHCSKTGFKGVVLNIL